MQLHERTKTTVATVPAWSIMFLRDTCSDLQHRLNKIGGHETSMSVELETICRWSDLLNAVADAPEAIQEPLEELQFLHAQILTRTEQRGVADISLQVEYLVRAVLIDRLQRATDAAVAAVQVCAMEPI
ncbi:hypothetical protein [Euzebya tangerina]|uniref:hypothetical protein n=1 Tax=Euzebya tangerina TaxID=591198 RepID=UPI000E31D385|nr:hypothetical protein [Euzebya tangerina]